MQCPQAFILSSAIPLTVAGVQFPLSDEAQAQLQELQKGSITYVQLVGQTNLLIAVITLLLLC